MSDIQFIREIIEKTAFRHRLHRGWRGLWAGVLAGAALWLVALAIYKFAPAPEALIPVAGMVAAACVPVGFLVGFWRKPGIEDTARWLDQRQHLQERLSSALELADEEKAGGWRELLLADAAAHARQFDPRTAMPFSLPALAKWCLLALVVGFTLGFIPEYRSKGYLDRRKEAEIIRDTGKELAGLTQRSLERRAPVMEPTRQALDSVKELGEQMSRMKLTRADALKDLANMAERLKDETRELGRNPALRKLEQAARSQTGRTSNSRAEIQKQVDSLQQQLGNPKATPDALDKLQRELQKLQKAAAGMPAADSAGAREQREAMSQALLEMQRQAEALGLSLSGLNDAIQAFQHAEIDQFLQDLKFAEIDLEKLRDMARALEQLERQMAELGRDLAEQLERGQATAAQGTLQKMIDELNSASLSPERLEKMLAEVDKAVKPGSQFGKVGEHLKEAVKQMRDGGKPGAAQSLAEASQELKRMMDQLGDAQSMMAALEALQRAQMCVGNRMSWGQCRNSGPGLGRGNRPGRGVGDWANDKSGWFDDYAYKTEPWDNSSIPLSDMKPRNLIDRGDPELSDDLTPTKVRGQISPGSPMPSITLKGVSIKGTSRVAYEEAVASAQSDAQSALSQEQVPRAYQGAVRDYFDDLKE